MLDSDVDVGGRKLYVRVELFISRRSFFGMGRRGR